MLWEHSRENIGDWGLHQTVKAYLYEHSCKVVIFYDINGFPGTGVYMDHFDDVASLTAALNARIAAISDPGTCNMPLYGFVNNWN